MADHIRKAIRSAAKAALVPLPTSMGEVFAYRVFPIEPNLLPLISVHTPGDEILRASPGADTEEGETIERVVDLRVTAYTGTPVPGETFDDALDAVSLEVEKAIAGGLSVDGLELRADYQGAVITYEGGDQSYGSVQMKWFVEAIHQSETPDDLIA